jgi:hypothetical protein
MEENINEEESGIGIVHILLYALLLVALGISLFFNLTAQEKQPVPIVQKEKCDTFDKLPIDIKDAYVKKEEFAKLEVSILNLEEKNQNLEKELLGTEDTDQNRSAEVCLTKTTMVKDFAKCYNMENGSYSITHQCKKAITNYVDKYKDAKYFDIISLVDDEEFKLFKNLERNNFIYDKLGVTQGYINRLKKFTLRGLAKDRAVEASWVIKAHTNRKAKTFNAHYELISKSGKRGVIVRAYH